MSWTFSADLPTGGTMSITLPDAEFRDVTSLVPRQAVAITDGGQKFVQDLLVEDKFYDISWVWLDDDNRSDLIRFLRAVNFQSEPFQITITGSRFPSFPVGLNTGQAIEGTAINTGLDPACSVALSTGQIVRPDTAIVNGVLFENPDFLFEQVRDGRSDISVRLRLPGGPIIAEA